LIGKQVLIKWQWFLVAKAALINEQEGQEECKMVNASEFIIKKVMKTCHKGCRLK